jgi:hypothetical protein
MNFRMPKKSKKMLKQNDITPPEGSKKEVLKFYQLIT